MIEAQTNKILTALTKVEAKISREYDRYESIEDNMSLLEPLVHYQFKKNQELTAIKQKPQNISINSHKRSKLCYTWIN